MLSEGNDRNVNIMTVLFICFVPATPLLLLHFTQSIYLALLISVPIWFAAIIVFQNYVMKKQQDLDVEKWHLHTMVTTIERERNGTK